MNRRQRLFAMSNTLLRMRKQINRLRYKAKFLGLANNRQSEKRRLSCEVCYYRLSGIFLEFKDNE